MGICGIIGESGLLGLGLKHGVDENVEKLKQWTSPSGQRRVYVGDAYISETGTCARGRYPYIQPFDTWSLIPEFEPKTFEALWVAAGVNTPMPVTDFSAYGIIHLSQAARMAGIAFRNGLSKAELIDRIRCAPPKVQEATLAALQRLTKGEAPSPAPREGFDIEDEPAPVSQAESKPSPEYVTHSQLRQALTDLGTEVQGVREKSEKETRAQLAALQAEVHKLQNLRPIEFRFPEKPKPIKVEGLRHPLFPKLIAALRAGKHVALTGPAGTGKTTAAEQAAEALGMRLLKVAPYTDKFEVLGYNDAAGVYHKTDTVRAVEEGGLLLIDEWERSNGDALIFLNAVLDLSPWLSTPEGMVKKHPEFRCILAGNTDGSGATLEYASAQRQDGSTLDRIVNLQWGATPEILKSMAQGREDWLQAVQAIQAFVQTRSIRDVIATPRAILHGADLMLKGGLTPLDALEMTCKRGALIECWPQILTLPAVASFLKGV